jgi:3-(3-hydroxy-phenyl)propionate hydroxylase
VLDGLQTDAVLLPGVGLEWLASHEKRAAVLRPDRYVFAVASDRAELVDAVAALPVRPA